MLIYTISSQKIIVLSRMDLQLFACKAEALLKLHQLEEADSALSNVPRFELSPPASQTKFFGMLCDSYPLFVRAQVEMALGR